MSSGDSDSENRPYIAWDESAGRLQVSLPHHCDEWDIGGPVQVKRMIQNLRRLLPEFKRPDAYRHAHPCPRCEKVRYFSGTRCEGIFGNFPLCNGGNVCSGCFYPAQAERQEACQAAQHPGRACEMPWCWTCEWCREGCQCKAGVASAA